MPWSTAISVGGSLLGGAFGSSSAKKAASDAKKVAREQMDRQMITGMETKYDLQPFLNSGQDANALLSEYLGIASPKGYAPKPTRDQVANEASARHFKRFGRGYSAQASDMGTENNSIDAEYARRLAEWESGLEKYKAENPDDGTQGGNFGRLLREFTNEDFVKDPGYNFRRGEGEKGQNRSFAARGGYNSGAALKALARYNQDYASNEFTNAFNRDAANKNSIYSFLSGTAGDGQNAAATKAGFMQGSANNQAKIAQNMSNQVGNYQMQGANAMNNGIQGAIGNLIYGMNRPSNSPVSSIPTWSTPGINGASSSKPWYLE